ncbi:MAG: 2-hydroxychromene-2-carboxylate isomerase [Cohaesibacter sp.]|nr:2-hydroxychromene-2-carboxylate isomerase [Cohaesibacter sp.]
MQRIEFWFEFASTYSYLAAMRADEVAHEHGIELIWKPFLLGAIFKKDLGYADSPFNRHEKKSDYMWRDIARLAQMRGLPPLTVPEPFPQNGLLAARIATALLDDERLPVFVRSVFRAEYQYGETISQSDVLFDILTQNGFDAPSLMKKAETNLVKTKLKELTDSADKNGIFGAPAFVTQDGELFWGDDRLETACLWAKRVSG